MTAKRFKFAAAVTLIEVMVAMVVLAIAATGALGINTTLPLKFE